MLLGGITTRFDVHRQNSNPAASAEGIIGYNLTLDAAERMINKRLEDGVGKSEEYHILKITTERV